MVKRTAGTLTSHSKVPGFKFQLGSQFQPPVKEHPEKQQVMVQRLAFLLLRWEISSELRAWSDPIQPLGVLGELTSIR